MTLFRLPSDFDYFREGFWITMGSLLGFTLVAVAAALLADHEAHEAEARAKAAPALTPAATLTPAVGGSCGV
ncbi:MAG TPA: hypothetical protein VHN99_05925 [Deinococcales bacterium]|nr:hypothetical protein [Deinococcales bacterium]